MSDYLVPIPRNERLELGARYTMKDLVDFGWERTDVSGEYRPMLVSETNLVRPLPLKLLEACKIAYDQEHYPHALFSRLYAAFSIYREAVSRQPFASALVMVNGACEFPEPFDVRWDDLDGVLFLGMLLGANEEITRRI